MLSNPLLDLVNASLSFRGTGHDKALLLHLVLNSVAKLTIEGDSEILLIAQRLAAFFYTRVQLMIALLFPAQHDC